MKFIFTYLILIIFLKPCFALTILVDPGHGGDDEGAKVEVVRDGQKVLDKEKDLSLIYAKKIYELLNKKHQVFLTRSVDRVVTLPERAQIAEKVKADLFISVHINSAPDTSSTGFETFYLDNHDDVASLKVERTENNSMNAEDPSVEKILIDLVVSETVKTSKPLAYSIHQEVKNIMGPKHQHYSRGIKPGLFYVLALSKRPGVLLEVGFLSTRKDRLKMHNEKFQNDYARAVVSGIEKYIKLKKLK